MQTYRVYIGSDDNTLNWELRDQVMAVADKHFEAYTALDGEGIYKGAHEAACVVEVIALNETQPVRENVVKFATDVRDTLRQECVLITVQDVESFLV